MITELNQGVLQIKISLLIVEDKHDQAFSLAKTAATYNSIFNDKTDIHGNNLLIEYVPVINGNQNLEYAYFKGNMAYAESMKYVKSGKGYIDIILCDHNLTGAQKDGDIFLQEVSALEKECNFRIYKILHSVLPKFQKFQRELYIDAIYDSKATNNVIVMLESFEEKILRQILFGNQEIYDLAYNKYREEKHIYAPNVETLTTYREVSVNKILYAHSAQKGVKREKYKFAYLQEDYSVSTLHHYESLNEFDIELFFKPNRSIYVNKLWFADKDFLSNKIKFITKGNDIQILNIFEIFKNSKQKFFLFDSFLKLFHHAKPKYPISSSEQFFRM